MLAMLNTELCRQCCAFVGSVQINRFSLMEGTITFLQSSAEHLIFSPQL